MEEADPVVTTMWAAVASWFTPTMLFCFLNLMIGTIFITSKFKTHLHNPPHQTQQPGDDDDNPYRPTQLFRASSILDRVRSINLSVYTSDHQDEPVQAPLVRAPSILDRLKSFNFSLHRSEHPDPVEHEPQHDDPVEHEPQHDDPVEPEPHHDDPVEPEPHHDDPDPSHDHHVKRTKSDTTADGEVRPARRVTAARLRKSASEKSMAEGKEDAEEVDRRRPATVREGKQTASFGEDEGGVDAKADDFINKFKQQLKLQRLDSLLRVKDMLTRGAAR